MSLTKSGSGPVSAAKLRHEPEFTKWLAIHSAEHDAAADSWFADQSLVPISKYLSNRGETAKTMSNIKHWLTRYFEPLEVNVPEKLMIDVDLLGDPIPISDSTFGKSITDALTKQKRSWRFAPQFSEYTSQFDISVTYTLS
jgi:hypothetical protein